MSTFIGKYEAKADVKGRIFIPSTYRKLLPQDQRERLVMRKDADNDCLVLYPESVWTDKIQDLKSKLDEWNSEDQMLHKLSNKPNFWSNNLSFLSKKAINKYRLL